MINGGTGKRVAIWLIVAYVALVLAQPLLQLLGATPAEVIPISDASKFLGGLIVGVFAVNVGNSGKPNP